MKLRLPASYEDLTLRHLMTLETTEDPIKRVQAVTGLSFDLNCASYHSFPSS